MISRFTSERLSPIQPSRQTFSVIGVDLGQQIDFSALVLLQWESDNRRYDLKTLKRWQRGTPYTTIAADVARFSKKVAGAVMAVDATGVGLAVAEMFRLELKKQESRCGFVSVTITAGNAITLAAPGCWHVSKRQLVGILQAVLGTKRLRIAESLPEAQTLIDELIAFKVKVNKDTGYEHFESKTGAHDDLVIATAIGTWAAECLDVFKVKPKKEEERVWV